MSNNKEIRKFILLILIIFGLISNFSLNAQNIGYGTTTPVAKLDISGKGRTGDLFRVYNDKNSLLDSIFLISSRGNVGIGIISPVQKLHVVGTGRFTGLAGSGVRMVVADSEGDLSTQSMANHSHAILLNGNGLSGGNYDGSIGRLWYVVYGSTANTAVQGNQTASILAGTGLSGGISSDALGDGFSATLNVDFAGSGAASTASRSDHNHTYNVNNDWLRDNSDDANVKIYGNSRQMAFRTDGTVEYASGVGGYPFVWMYGGNAASNRRMILNSSGQLWVSNYGWLHDYFWSSINDGAASGLDADLLDGLSSSAFIRSNANDDVNANTEWQDNFQVSLGSDADFRMWHNGTDNYFRSYLHGSRWYLQGEDTGGTNRAMIYSDPDSWVRLYYAGNQKLETTSSGISVAGDVAVTGNVDGYDISAFGPYWIDSAGSNGQVWTSDGSGQGSWQSAGSIPSGSNGQTLYNDSGTWTSGDIIRTHSNMGTTNGFVGINSPATGNDTKRIDWEQIYALKVAGSQRIMSNPLILGPGQSAYIGSGPRQPAMANGKITVKYKTSGTTSVVLRRTIGSRFDDYTLTGTTTVTTSNIGNFVFTAYYQSQPGYAAYVQNTSATETLYLYYIYIECFNTDWDPIYADFEANLTVDNNVVANSFIAKANGSGSYKYNTNSNMTVPDYVFNKYFIGESKSNPEYSMMNLSEFRNYIRKNKHLPRVPSRERINNDGAVNLQGLCMITLEKVEELALYILELEDQNNELKSLLKESMANKDKEMESLESRLEKLEQKNNNTGRRIFEKQ